MSEFSLKYAIATDLAKLAKAPALERALTCDEILTLIEATRVAVDEVRLEAVDEMGERDRGRYVRRSEARAPQGPGGADRGGSAPRGQGARESGTLPT